MEKKREAIAFNFAEDVVNLQTHLLRRASMRRPIKDGRGQGVDEALKPSRRANRAPLRARPHRRLLSKASAPSQHRTSL